MNKTTITEFRMLLSCFTFVRFGNLIKLEASRWWSKITSKPILWGFPYAISVEPTSYCNLHCKECPSGSGLLTRPQGMMAMELYQKIIDEASRYAFYLTLYFQGEPLMHPQIGAMIAYAKSKRMFVFTSTNGHFLTEKNAKIIVKAKTDKVIISLDGASQNDYKQYRVGGNLNTVIDGMCELALQRQKHHSSRPIIVAQVLLLKTTENQRSEIKKIALTHGADVVEFKKAQFYNPNDEGSLLPQNPDYSRYVYNTESGWQLKQNKKVGCKRLWSAIVVTWDGNVLPCCYDKDADFIFGNLTQDHFKTITHTQSAKIFRKNVLKSRTYYDICQNCGE